MILRDRKVNEQEILYQTEADYRRPEIRPQRPEIPGYAEPAVNADCVGKLLYVLIDTDLKVVPRGNCARCDGTKARCTTGLHASFKKASPRIREHLVRLRNFSELGESVMTEQYPAEEQREHALDVYALVERIEEEFDPRHPQALIDTAVMHGDEIVRQSRGCEAELSDAVDEGGDPEKLMRASLTAHGRVSRVQAWVI